jgi:peptide/nickel transport system substrate-binding protein
MVRYIAFLLVWLVVLPVLASPHDTLTMGVQQFPNTLNPNTDSSSIKDFVLSMARPDFTTYDKDWKLVCILCTALPDMSNGTARVETINGKPQISLTYTLQPGATWDDGVPVTTADVLFSLEVGRYPRSGYVNATLYTGDEAGSIDTITAVDDKTFTVRLKGAPCDYQGLNDFRIIPAHIEKPIFDADPDMYRNHSKYDTDPTAPGLYYGPYKITEVVRGSSVELTRNPTWWGKKPAFEHVRIDAFENTSTLQSALLSGEVDYLPGEVGIPETVALNIKKRYGDRFNVVFKPSLIDQHIDLNQDNPALQDVRVRRALLYALDRQTINQAIYDGQYEIENSFVDPLDSVYSKDVVDYAYDPDRANQLLDEAGYTARDRGVRVNAAGQRLSFEISTTAGDRRREELEQTLLWYWSKVGVELRIKNQPARVLFGQTLPHRAYPAMALYSWTMAPHNIPRTTYDSKSIPTAANGYSGENFIGWNNPDMDRLITDMETKCAPADNQAAWMAAQRLYTEQLPSLPLFYRTDGFVMPQWLKGVQPTGHEYPSSMWIEDWFVEGQ